MSSYTPDEILELAPAIERMGGALLPEKCEGRFVPYQVPGTDKSNNIKTCHCQNNAMYVLPYEPTDAKGTTTSKEFRARGAGYARACVHCDLVGHWPNFENVLSGDEE